MKENRFDSLKDSGVIDGRLFRLDTLERYCSEKEQSCEVNEVRI